MTKLHNTSAITTSRKDFEAAGWTVGRDIPVGHNRKVRMAAPAGRLVLNGYLHNNRVMRAFRNPETGVEAITLETCGYKTATTRSAMTEFLNALGIEGGVSFAGGKFTARIKVDGEYKTFTSTSGEVLNLIVPLWGRAEA